MVLTPSLEDYLEEIYRLWRCGEGVRARDVAARLVVSLPSVNRALLRLSEEGLVAYRRYGRVKLTPEGAAQGQFLVERNELLREFLQVIRSSCNVEAEAEAVEHYLSQPTLAAIERLVKFMDLHPDYLDELNAPAGG